MLPVRFILPMFLTSGQDKSIFDSLESLVSYCEKAKIPALPTGLPYSYLTEILYYNFSPKLLKEDGSVDKEKIEKFVDLVKRFCDAQQAQPTNTVDWYDRMISEGYLYGEALSTYNFMLEEQSLMFVNMSGNIIWYPDEAKQRGGELIGNHGMFFANGMLGLNAHSKQKNLVEIFIKEAFSYELQSIDTYRGGFSVHRKVLEEEAEQDYSRHMLSSGKDAPGDIYQLNGASNEDIRQIIDLARSANTPVERDRIIFDIFVEEICSFLNGRKVKEAAVEEIVNRLDLYYHE